MDTYGNAYNSLCLSHLPETGFEPDDLLAVLCGTAHSAAQDECAVLGPRQQRW
jgi:hypothetical protein